MHGVVVLIAETFLVLIGVLGWVLHWVFPTKWEKEFECFERVDIWTALAVLSLFGTYTVIRVTLRLARGVREEYSGQGKHEETSGNRQAK